MKESNNRYLYPHLELPEINYLKDAIAGGLIGEILSSSMLGSGGVWGPVVIDESYLYLTDPKNGATMMDIAFSCAWQF